MASIRILLATVPASLRAAVHMAVLGEPDLIVVGEVDREIETLLEVGRTRVDVVVVGMPEASLPPVAERLVDEYPRVGVLAVDLERDAGLLYSLRPHSTPIGDVAAGGLAAAIRQLAADLAG